MLEVKDLCFSVGNMDILHNVSLSVPSGQVLALCGPNGAGKSTILSALAGDLRPSSGIITLDGQALSAIPPNDLAARRAVLEQHPTLGVPFSVQELLALSIPREIPMDTANRIIADILDAVGLREKQHHNCLTLSGGQRHRAHLARILVQLECSSADQKYLLLDEPVASLDLAHQISTLRITRSQARTGTGVLIVLHDLNLAAAYADQIVLLKNGQIVAQDTPHNLLTEALLSHVYETEIRVIQEAGEPPHIKPVYQ